MSELLPPWDPGYLTGHSLRLCVKVEKVFIDRVGDSSILSLQDIGKSIADRCSHPNRDLRTIISWILLAQAANC